MIHYGNSFLKKNVRAYEMYILSYRPPVLSRYRGLFFKKV